MACTKTYRFTPTVGMEVGVCYDGKWSRAQKGVVVSVERHFFFVRFEPWASSIGGEVECRVARQKGGNKQFHLWLDRPGEGSVMKNLFGLQGDYYSVMPREVLEEAGYWK
jgi:hypothetical protein